MDFTTFENIDWGSVQTTIIASIIFGLFSFVIISFRKRIIRFFNFFFINRNIELAISFSTKRYLKSLYNETLRIKHSWKLEGKSLLDLFIPIYIIDIKRNRRISILQYLNKEFLESSTPKLLLLGEAGSGKSVSLGQICREIGVINKDKSLLPILLSFSEIKDVKSNHDFINIIVEKLEEHQFSLRQHSLELLPHMQKCLENGEFFLLLDGLDELERSSRIEISRVLCHFLRRYRQTPFIISSRKSVWKHNSNLFSSLNHEIIEMASFSSSEIRIFVSQWDFSGRKSATELANIIRNKPYLNSIANNPLMLTIITFLYSQPKRILPDNRVLFYKECIDALFEKWDNSKVIDRANRFETIDKVPVLNELAYDHIISSNETDEDIEKKKVIAIIEKVMIELSRPIEKRELMLDEIVNNAELLIYLPPSSYKFPHRTFMEFFAANFFYEENKYQELLSLYKSDKGKWEETLLLFCGLNVNKESSSFILEQLLDDFISSQNFDKLNVLVSKALMESARLAPSVADKVLTEIEKYLDINFNSELVENLGFIATNESWSHHVRARQILVKLLDKELNEDMLIDVLLALLKANNKELTEVIFQNIKKISISTFIVKLGKNYGQYAVKLIDQLEDYSVRAVIKELVESGAFDLLFVFLINSKRTSTQYEAAYQLALKSNSSSFFKFMDILDLSFIDITTYDKLKQNFNDWRWEKQLPKTEDGKFAILLICYKLSDYFISINKFSLEKNEDIHIWLKFITSCFISEKGYRFSKHNLLNQTLRATKKGLKHYWRASANQKNSKKDILIPLTLLYHIVNFLMLSTTDDNVWIRILGVSSILGFSAIVSAYAAGALSNSFTKNRALNAFLAITSLPLIIRYYFLSSWIRKYPMLLLVLGCFFGWLFMQLPIVNYLKLFYFIVFTLTGLIDFFSAFINRLGKIFPNDKFIELLGTIKHDNWEESAFNK